jgi:UDP-3-O-[3-hydroxymyristoyl] N-acetylglucosamine deacetylase
MNGQTTVARAVSLEGTGLVTGKRCRLTISPAEDGRGLVFIANGVKIPALVENLYSAGPRVVSLSRRQETVLSVEHLLSALNGRQISNALLTVRGGEVPAGPALDSAAYTEVIKSAGLLTQATSQEFIRVPDDLDFDAERSHAQAGPDNARLIESRSLKVHVQIEFGAPIGAQEISLEFAKPQDYEQVSDARSFMRSAADQVHPDGRSSWDHLSGDLLGLPALGSGGLITFTRDGAWLDGPLPADEPARHKVLDLLGDLALLGRPVIGSLVVTFPGHEFNARLCRHINERLTA